MSTTVSASSFNAIASTSTDARNKRNATQLGASPIGADCHIVDASRSQSPDSILSFDEEEAWSSAGHTAGPDSNVVLDVKRSSANMFSAVLKHQGYLEQLLEHADCLGSAGCECEFCFLERGGLL